MKAFDLRPIVENFYEDILENEERSDFEAYALLALPALISTVALKRPINADFISVSMIALSILFGFTFSSLLTTAKYSAKEDRIEEKVVKETRLGTSYALLVNLLTLIAVIGVSIAITDYDALSSTAAIGVSLGVYFLIFHYLLVMLYLMRYLYLLVIGGALEEQRRPHSPSSAGSGLKQTQSKVSQGRPQEEKREN